MNTCTSEWYSGMTCDHLYDDCPSRKRAEPELRRHGWWDLGQRRNPPSLIDPHGPDVCGVCVHRHVQIAHRKEASA